MAAIEGDDDTAKAGVDGDGNQVVWRAELDSGRRLPEGGSG